MNCQTFFRAGVLLLASVAAARGAEPQLVARWDFDRGRGNQALDSSGNRNHGLLHGARRVASGDGYALRLDGVDDYVDCGNDPSLDLRGSLTMTAWVRPAAPPRGEPGILGKFYESYAITFYKGSAWFYISGGGNNLQTGLTVGKWQHLVAVFDGKTMRLFLNGELAATKESLQTQVASGGNFLLGCVMGDPANSDEALRNTSFFAGLLDAVRVYDAPLTERQIIELYKNEQADEKGCLPIDVSRIGQLMVTPYLYPQDREMVAEVDYGWLKPLPSDAEIRVSLARVDGAQATALDRRGPLPPSPHAREVEFEFSLDGLGEGAYQLTAQCGEREATAQFILPATVPPLPSPDQQIAGPLPEPTALPKFELAVSRRGGMNVSIGNQSFPVESLFSYPHGGENGLTMVKEAAATAESRWTVRVDKGPNGSHRVRAEGEFYRLERQIRVTDSRIEVEDAFTNKTDDVLGIIVSNHVNLRKLPDANPVLHANPTVFVARENCGLGLIALDDVYFLQLENEAVEGLARLRDSHFGLAPRAAYTIRWAVYPTGSADYYDFINQVRRDEKLNGRVRGSLTLSTGWAPPSEEEVRLKGLGYFSQCYLTNVLSNPTISLEGWEFVEYPEVAGRIRQTLRTTRERYPDLQVGIHVAHALYAMNDPQRFADSRAIADDGSQVMYGPNSMEYYGRYFSRELVENNWRWWIFYPTLENSFGRLMLDASDSMIRDLGANFMWADGYISGYVKDGYTYDRFDGHSVTIDPETKLVARKKAHVTLASLPVLKAVARKFAAAGGTLVSNGKPGPPSYWQEQTVTSNETGGGDQQPISAMHLGRTVTPLGNPSVIHSERDIYRDVLAKLRLGALYFFYGETDHRPGGHNYVTHESLVKHMYPITFDRINLGVVRGVERIVASKAGVYGWPGDRMLHQVFLSDARGRIVPNRFVTTADDAGVRTQLQLAENEAAVVARIPVACDASEPVNLRVTQYNAEGLELIANGRSQLRLIVNEGTLPINAGRSFQLSVGGQTSHLTPADGSVAFDASVQGLTEIRLTPQLAGPEPLPLQSRE